MPVERAGAAELARLQRLIDEWAEESLRSNALLAAVDRDPEIRRWYIRLHGDEKAIITLWLTLRERTLYFETYFMPAPEENHGWCYEYLLRANPGLYGWRFAVGQEDAVYLVGQLPLATIDEDELDRIVGSGWAYTERYFAAAMSIGYASKFRRQQR